MNINTFCFVNYLFYLYIKIKRRQRGISKKKGMEKKKYKRKKKFTLCKFWLFLCKLASCIPLSHESTRCYALTAINKACLPAFLLAFGLQPFYTC
jgi:hypothetical protein